jgi:hypothetical protein
MASPVEVQLLLCDAASADPSTGKIHMLGAGWSVTGSPTGQQAVAVLMKIPWDRANQRIPFTLQLFDSDGQPVQLRVPDGVQEIKLEGHVEVGRPAGIAPGSPLDASLALNVPPLPLGGGRYEWKLEIAEKVVAVSFQVIAGPRA